MTYREIRLACDTGIAALTMLYGECPKGHFDPDCIACWSGKLIRDMREMRDELEYDGEEPGDRT